MDGIRIRYSKTETGWALLVKKQRHARIDNIPCTPRINIDDIVELEDPLAVLPEIKRVIMRVWQYKFRVLYSEPFQSSYDKIKEIVEHSGLGKVEGLYAGTALIATNRNDIADLLPGLQVSLDKLHPVSGEENG